MNIALFSDNFYPEISGITDSITLLGRELVGRGHSVLFVVPRYAKRDYKKAGIQSQEQEYPQNFSIERMPAIRYPYSPTGQSRIALPFGRSIPRIKKFVPDIIHTHSPFGAGLEALIASRRTQTPLVGTNHTPISEFIKYSPLHSHRITKMALRYFSWYYNHCEYITTPCQSLLTEMKENGFHRAHKSLSNPIDLEHFGPSKNNEEKQKLKKRFGFSSHTILYTGRLAVEKHIDVIIRAIADARQSIPDLSFAITGIGSSEKSLRDLTQKLGLERSVLFLGHVDEKILPLIYKASDIFVIMSTAESQSLSLMNAMASGLPVIGARARALPEYITPRNGIIVNVGDFKGLSHEIIKLCTSPDYTHTLGLGGMTTVREFRPSAIAKVWETIYNDVIWKHRKLA
jgi:glycosyltransferase involved in cell wall biosynthesis